MQKTSGLKKQIEQILLSPPSLKLMLQELRLNNVLLRKRAGNIELFGIINPSLVERVWRAFKINNLLDENKEGLKNMGLNPKTISPDSVFADQVNQIFNFSNQNPIEGFAKKGGLELEVFREENLNKN